MRFTVFTPAYNRGYVIERLYNSLKRQTFKDFEWVVVDDCSTDDTKKIFDSWTSVENEFDIVYSVQEQNGGKHRAINKGMSVARGELFFIVDSDDYLTDDALEKVDNWISGLPDGEKFAGVSGMRGYSQDKPIGTSPTHGHIDCTSLERDKYNLYGDKAEVFFTDVLKNYPFPSVDGENFITESVVWYAIASDGYKIRWYDEIIYICEYLPDGLSSGIRERLKANPRGTMLYAKSSLSYPQQTFKSKISSASLYCMAAKEVGMTLSEVSKELRLSKCFLRFSILVRKLSGRNS